MPERLNWLWVEVMGGAMRLSDWRMSCEFCGIRKYLEEHNILHRDIKPANVMIDSNENVKIIDFGFGKILSPTQNEENSIILNWPVTEMPNEIQLAQEYNHATEVYFVGKLFQHITDDDSDFLHKNIIERMIKLNPKERYSSFSEVSKAISAGVLSEIDFVASDKRIYQEFADHLTNHISHYNDKYIPIKNIHTIKLRLADVIRNSSLEQFIQQNNQLISCFIDGGYSYNTLKNIPVQIVIDFYDLITRLSDEQQSLLYNNLYNRLASITIKQSFEDEDDLPF